MSFARFASRALALVLLVGALVAWPAHLWDGADGLTSLGIAAGITFVGALCGHLASLAVFRRMKGPHAAVNAMNAGLGSRLLVTLALSLVVITVEPFRLIPFAAWLAIYYVALLGLEVFVGLREFGQTSRSAEESEPSVDEPPTAGPSIEDEAS